MTQPERNRRTGQGAGNPPRPVYDPLPERRNFLRALAAMFTDKADGRLLVVDAESPGGVATADPDHGAQSGLQGGSAGEYYHLSAAELAIVQIMNEAATAGAMAYFDGSVWQLVDASTAANGDVLTFVSGVPTWQAPAP